jgi:hypothetical protein
MAAWAQCGAGGQGLSAAAACRGVLQGDNSPFPSGVPISKLSDAILRMFPFPTGLRVCIL